MSDSVKPMRAGLPSADWDRLAGTHFYSSSSWLQLCDAWPRCSIGAAVHSKDGNVVNAVPVSRHIGAPPTFYRWNDLLGSFGLPGLQPTGIIVGADQGYQTHFLVADGHDRVAAVEGLLANLRAQQGHLGGQACVAMYVTTADVRTAHAAGVRTPPVLLEPDAWFDLPAGGWAPWLQTLPSKRRVNIRREVRDFVEAGYTIEHVALAECHEELAALAVSTQGKYGHTGHPNDYLANFRRHIEVMGGRARVALCRLQGHAVGFCLYYVHGNTLHLRWAGFDYDRLAGAAEYFNLVYYDHVARSPKTGIRRIHAGIKAAEAKALRGATLYPLWLLDLSADSVLRRTEAAVRAHNAAMVQRLTLDRRTASALGNAADWDEYC